MWVGVGAGDVRVSVLAYTHSCMLNFLLTGSAHCPSFRYTPLHFQVHTRTNAHTHTRKTLCLSPSLSPSLPATSSLPLPLPLFLFLSHVSCADSHCPTVATLILAGVAWSRLASSSVLLYLSCSIFYCIEAMRTVLFTVSRLCVHCVSPWSWLALSSVYDAWCMRALS